MKLFFCFILIIATIASATAQSDTSRAHLQFDDIPREIVLLNFKETPRPTTDTARANTTEIIDIAYVPTRVPCQVVVYRFPVDVNYYILDMLHRNTEMPLSYSFSAGRFPRSF